MQSQKKLGKLSLSGTLFHYVTACNTAIDCRLICAGYYAKKVTLQR